MGLSTFITARREKILQEWVRFARTILPSADETELRDHAGELLEAVVVDMKAPQSAGQQARKSEGDSAGGRLAAVGYKHAAQRLATGFDLGQLVSEYRALRASILRLWTEEQGDGDTEATRFHEAIDESLMESTARYTEMVATTRDQFLGILGHDLRNPLGAISIGAALLARDETLDDKQARVASRIVASAQRMSRLIDDLLDLTRTRLGAGLPVTRTQGDLGMVCEQAISELSIVFPGSRVTFEPRGSLAGDWDGDRIAQVVSNLVANALQHGDANGRVVVRAEDQDGAVALQVWNSGPPIPPEMMKNIFEPMAQGSRADGAPAAHTNGLGLGLYIARQIAVAHGGTLEVTSTASEGTTFTAQLPRHAARSASAPPPEPKRGAVQRGHGA